MTTPTRKKPLPKIISTTRASYGLIVKLYEEESFDCLKEQIRETAGVLLEKRERRAEKKLTNRERRKAVREDLRDKLIARYGADVFERLSSNRKRRTIRAELTDQEASVLSYFANRLKDVKRVERRKREPRKTKRFTYDTYINSKAWERRRNKYWQTHEKRCAVCFTAAFIHLHHMSYKKLGDEPDNHLIALCKDHHAQYHAEHGVQRHMVRTTMAFVENERAKCGTNIH